RTAFTAFVHSVLFPPEQGGTAAASVAFNLFKTPETNSSASFADVISNSPNNIGTSSDYKCTLGRRHCQRQHAFQARTLAWCGGLLRERDEMAARILDRKFLHAVKRRPNRHDQPRIFHRSERRVEIVHLHVE